MQMRRLQAERPSSVTLASDALAILQATLGILPLLKRSSSEGGLMAQYFFDVADEGSVFLDNVGGFFAPFPNRSGTPLPQRLAIKCVSGTFTSKGC